ncbi:MAG: universal stress protein [Planctomycetia bacterium]|nr:universal stress protein [Planctomycetia bacterium]
MHRFHRLTVALSRTDTDPGLIRYAAAVARLGTATEVHFVHALSPNATDSEAARHAMEADVSAHFTDVPASVARSFDILRGAMLDELLKYVTTKQTDLLFLGHRRDHPGRWALARRLAMKAPCSVWMVPQGSLPAVDRILVPVDFSEPSADALRVGASLAKLTGGECLALHVYFNEAVVSFEEYDRIRRGQEQNSFNNFIEPLDLQGISVTPVFEESANVAHAINRVAVSRGCELVVMATRGRSRSAAILLGSVTEETITEMTIPLLVVKHYGAQIGTLRALLELGFGSRQDPQFD